MLYWNEPTLNDETVFFSAILPLFKKKSLFGVFQPFSLSIQTVVINFYANANETRSNRTIRPARNGDLLKCLYNVIDKNMFIQSFDWAITFFFSTNAQIHWCRTISFSACEHSIAWWCSPSSVGIFFSTAFYQRLQNDCVYTGRKFVIPSLNYHFHKTTNALNSVYLYFEMLPIKWPNVWMTQWNACTCGQPH